MSELIGTPASLYRGGTSKALFLNAEDLPCKTRPLLNRWILAAFGSPDPSQLDGIGGAQYFSTKMAIVGKSKRADADVDFTMAIVRIEKPDIDWTQNCGNIISAVGHFAIDQGLFFPKGKTAKIRIYNTNTNSIIEANLLLDKTHDPKVLGSQSIDGVPGTGAPVGLNFSKSAGGITGKLFPTGSSRDSVIINSRRYEYSLIDFANLVAFLPASAFGLKGNENPADIKKNLELMKQVERVRGEIAFRIGLTSSPAKAFKETLGVPYVLLCSKPQNWQDGNKRYKASDCDIMLRSFCSGRAHFALPATAAVCAGVGVRIEETVLFDSLKKSKSADAVVRLGHPQGVIEVDAQVDSKDSGWSVKNATLIRTARRIMTGTIYVPVNYATRKIEI